MLLLYQHPDNKRTPPKLVSSYQQLYPLTQVDQSSRWVLEWTGLGGVLGNMMTDINTDAYKEATCLIQCEKGDIAIECLSLPIFPYPSLTLNPSLSRPPCASWQGTRNKSVEREES